MLRLIALLLMFLFWVFPEVASSLFILPIGDSQEWDLFHLSYVAYHNIWIFRILFGTLFISLAGFIWKASKSVYPKVLIGSLLLVYGVTIYMTNYVMRADKMFYPLSVQHFSDRSNNDVSLDRLVMGIEIEGNVKAYPIQYLAYHHQVVDTVGNEPIMVTYCSVCRTGRVFSSAVNGQNETFRLVGMSQWNAMFEDKTTKSWWQQATGEAIIGPLKGSNLKDIYSQQVTLGEWFEQYPQSLVLQPDTIFTESYGNYEDYEDGKHEGSLTRYDSLSWKDKSWVVGVELEGQAIAFDWNELKETKLIQHTLAGSPIMLLLGEENKSYRIWDRTVGSDVLDFVRNDTTAVLTDLQTHSIWAYHGECLSGPMKGYRLKGIQGSQEYWHSWQDFHPNTVRYPN